MTRRSRPGSRAAPTRAFPRPGATPTRRSPTCATARTPISRPPSTPAWAPYAPARRGQAAARQGAVVQQPARPQLRPRARRGVRRSRLRDRQAQQPLRLRARRDVQSAYERAFACDPLSAYGGVIALNRPVDRACAERLSEQFIEVLLAPGFDPAALEILQAKKNVRLLELPEWPAPAEGNTRFARSERPTRWTPSR